MKSFPKCNTERRIKRRLILYPSILRIFWGARTIFPVTVATHLHGTAVMVEHDCQGGPEYADVCAISRKVDKRYYTLCFPARSRFSAFGTYQTAGIGAECVKFKNVTLAGQKSLAAYRLLSFFLI